MDRDIPIEVTESAADWVDRLASEPSAGETGEFVRWLLRSPVHVEEFLRVSALRVELGQAATPEWVAELLERRDPAVAELPLPPSNASRPGSTVSRHRTLAMAAGVAMAALLGGIGWLVYPNKVDTLALSTVVGEQRILPLADGSTVQLNTDSSVEIRIGPTERQVDLIHGEALFDVAPDPARPFRVVSSDAVIEAIGTRFSVHRGADNTRVAVVEGRVAIDWNRASATRASPATTRPVELSAGQQAFWRADQAPIPTPVDPSKATAWTQRRLVFEDEVLEAVVAEFNRYNRLRLSVGDPALANRRITGVFDVNAGDEFIELLDELEPIEVRQTPDGHRTLYRATEH